MGKIREINFKWGFFLLIFIAANILCHGNVYAMNVYSTDINQGQGGEKFTFVHLTDLHIGEGIGDYGTEGYDDTAPIGDIGYAAEKLRLAVNWINDNYHAQNIDFVLVTGDLTDSGEKSEFLKCKEILDDLSIPYVPLLGNHDGWPYTDDTEAEGPIGDQYFKEVFESTFNELSQTFDEWEDGTRLTKVWNPENNCFNYFQNFAFTYNGYHFICTDFNARWHTMDGKKGIPSDANLYDFDGGTWRWFINHYTGYGLKGNDNMLIFSHHPLSKLFTTTCFSVNEYNEIASFLNDNGNKYNTGLWCAGHTHINQTYSVKTYSLSTICPGIETQPTKYEGLRLINVWGIQ